MNKNLILLALEARYPGYDKLHLQFAQKKLVGTTAAGHDVPLPPPSFDMDGLFDLYEFEYIVSITILFKTKQIKIVGDKTILI